MEKSRIEQILKYGLGEVSTLPPNLSRVEELLARLIEGGASSDTKIVSIGGRVDTVSELPSTAPEGTLYFVGYASDTNKAEYVMMSSGEWELLGYNTLVVDSALSSTSLNPVENRTIYAALGNKVDVVQGKQLSTEDYTSTEKTKLAGLNNYDDSAIYTALGGKVDKVTGKQLSTEDYTTAEKAKLESLENYDDAAVKSEIAVHQQSLGTRCKNLAKIAFTATTIDGVTVTPDSDGGIALNGTRSGTSPTIFVNDLASDAGNPGVLETRYTLPSGKYLIKGTGNDNVHIQFRCHDGTNSVTLSNSATDSEVTLDGTYPYYFLRIWVAGSASFDNFKFYPMLRLADIADDSFEKYQPSLQEQIDELKARVTALGG